MKFQCTSKIEQEILFECNNIESDPSIKFNTIIKKNQHDHCNVI